MNRLFKERYGSFGVGRAGGREDERQNACHTVDQDEDFLPTLHCLLSRSQTNGLASGFWDFSKIIGSGIAGMRRVENRIPPRNGDK